MGVRDPSSSPESPKEEGPPNKPLRRGPVLSLFLVFLGLRIVYALTLFIGRWEDAIRESAAPVVAAVIVVNLLRLYAVIAIWRLRRSGVVLYIGLAAAGAAIKLGAGVGETWYGAVTCAVLVLLVRRKWAAMR